ncbi:GspE/PulE family protein [Polynucleobacter sp. MWH-UH23A]|uniref:GspE/PulE family protein n=1 Tax=Polynucleobacter sp. MWH-UH23A TaxID=1855613 RepID=UPI00336500B5
MISIHDESFIIRTWQEIAENALHARASDIHIEARPLSSLVRIRVDGLLQTQYEYPIEFHERLITRIKILARLDIAEKRVPQDGRLCIGFNFSNPEIDCRVSLIPTLYGEKAVIRILQSQIKELDLEKIGLLPEQLDLLQTAIAQPNGLILVTGPTGSGKTRTLYSCLNKLNQTHRNLCSIEDPIEIRLPGVNQVAYHPRAGLEFSTIIKALLRQDPDVIMIGEIRDGATANLAIQAAQTGHLVLSTLHTRDARSALSRLQSLGVERELLESCLLCVSSQRLVRARCPYCREQKFDGGSDQSINPCRACKGITYLGRIGVHEVLNVEQVVNPSLAYISMNEAGSRHINAGLIDQVSLRAEIYSWH